MTYQQTISRFKEIILAHKFISEYGYGDISDIAVPEDKERPDYPYAFINPVQTTLNEKQFSATFNLIMMTQVLDNEDDELFGQSNCMKYINDVISQFVNTNNDPLMTVSLPVNMTPFKERFQDDVVGATALITINYGKAMSVCDSPITGIEPSTPYCPQVLVIDGDETQHYLDAGESYTCLPATAKSGILYQRVIPWDGYTQLSSLEGSVEWHRLQGTYDYTPPVNPVSSALKKNGYFGSDAQCLLAYDNRFGNNFRYTNDIGQQYTEGFDNDAGNHSDNPRLCIDHLTGLGIYVWQAYDRQSIKWEEFITYANNFSYAGIDDWRCGDIGEFLAIFDMNDWQAAWPTAYTPWMNPNVRNYGGRYSFGCMDKDGYFLSTITNSTTIYRTNNPDQLYDHALMVTNYYI